MKCYTEEQLQEIVLKAVCEGFNLTQYNLNAEHCGSIEECLATPAPRVWYRSVPLREVQEAANSILKELNVREISDGA